MREVEEEKASMAPEDRTAQEVSGLGLLRTLTSRLQGEGVPYCHWKSNEHLREAMLGMTDLDVLCARSAALQMGRILAETGFKRFAAVPARAYPGVEDYLALDGETGRLVHLHLHYQLTLGERHLKGYCLPWESLVLSTRQLDKQWDIYVADPSVEIILLIVRAALKLRSRDRLREVMGRPCLPGDALAEFLWLRERANPEKVAEIARGLLGRDATQLLEVMVTDRPSWRRLVRFRRCATPTLGLYRTYGAMAARGRRWLRELLWLGSASRKRYIRPAIPMTRTDPRGGLLIAFLGSDGSGKSTVGKEIASWLSWKTDVSLLYFGSGDGPGSALRWPLKLAIRLLRGGGVLPPDRYRASATKTIDSSESQRGFFSLWALGRICWAMILSLEKRGKLRRAWRGRNRGVFILCDRYPQNQVMGFNDGPLLSHLTGHPFRLFREAAKWESAPYRWAETNPPDLIIKLHVTPEVALARKPGMSIEEVRKRIETIERLRYPPAARTVDVDAGGPLEGVLLSVKRAVWREI